MTERGEDTSKPEAAYFTAPGWWKMLDRELKYFYDIDPLLSNVQVKEKYGRASVSYCVGTETRFDLLLMHEEILEKASMHTCELCGKYGKIRSERGWLQCLCDRCAAADRDERREIMDKTAADYQATIGWVLASMKDIPLTERDGAYLRYAAHYPDEMDKIVEQVIESHRAK